MSNVTIKWENHAELIKMTIQLGKKKIFDDLISKVSLREINEFLDETLRDKQNFKDKNTKENVICGEISDDDLAELYEYFDIEQ
ncbi:MAG: hypothetical protein QMC67_09620 [Candidatus Wallbacteria bacterium]